MFEVTLRFLPALTLVSHAVLVLLFLAVIFRRSWGSRVGIFLGKNALLLGFFISLFSVLGSLFYSEVVGYEPCVLCWWQRVFLYPLVIIFAMAFWRRARNAFLYATPLVFLAGIVALYHSFVSLGGTSVLPCTEVGSACAKVYVLAFGYITIPVMSLTVILYLLLLAWAYKLYKENLALDEKNSNS